MCCILYHHGGLPILTDRNLGRSPVAATALSALLPDQFCQQRHGLELLKKLEAKWPAFNLDSLAESVDRQHQEMGLGISNNSSLVQRCQGLGSEPSDPAVGTVEAARVLDRRLKNLGRQEHGSHAAQAASLRPWTKAAR